MARIEKDSVSGKERVIYEVSDMNRNKVLRYLIHRANMLGTNKIQEKVLEIAEGAGVALATAHRALAEFEAEGKLSVERPETRRFSPTYTLVEKHLLDFKEEETLNHLRENIKDGEFESKTWEHMYILTQELLRRVAAAHNIPDAEMKALKKTIASFEEVEAQMEQILIKRKEDADKEAVFS